MAVRAELLLANRAYLDHSTPPGAGAPATPAEGGLLAAVRPLIAPWDGALGTTWIGAGRGPADSGYVDAAGYELITTATGNLRHRRLFFDDDTWTRHYAGVSNGFLWPLLHLVADPLPNLVSYYPSPPTPANEDWEAYRAVNRRFAEAAMEERWARSCWLHDYQLALAPAMLRGLGFASPIGFFLHTPFPDLAVADAFLAPSARERFSEWLGGILGADLVGLQTPADVERLTRAAVALCGAEALPGGLIVNGRRVAVDAYSVGIDCDELLSVARVASPPEMVRPLIDGEVPLVVGLERADYTKGIPERLASITAAYRAGSRFNYLGVAAPTRAEVPAYQALGDAIAAAAREAEAAARDAGCSFLNLHESMPWPEVVALQRVANVVFTSSLADGMNLVPLQAAVAQSLRDPGERSVILAGRHAGVAQAFAGFEREGLVPVNPLNLTEMIESFTSALSGKPGRVSDRLIEAVRARDALSWATRFLADLEATRC